MGSARMTIGWAAFLLFAGPASLSAGEDGNARRPERFAIIFNMGYAGDHRSMYHPEDPPTGLPVCETSSQASGRNMMQSNSMTECRSSVLTGNMPDTSKPRSM